MARSVGFPHSPFDRTRDDEEELASHGDCCDILGVAPPGGWQACFGTPPCSCKGKISSMEARLWGTAPAASAMVQQLEERISSISLGMHVIWIDISQMFLLQCGHLQWTSRGHPPMPPHSFSCTFVLTISTL